MFMGWPAFADLFINVNSVDLANAEYCFERLDGIELNKVVVGDQSMANVEDKEPDMCV